MMDDEAFTRQVLRRARIRPRPPRFLVHVAGALGAGVAIVLAGSLLAGPTGPALAAIAAITWAVAALGDR